MVFTNKNRFFTITWEYCRISEKLVNIKNEIIKVKYFRTNWGSQILSNNGCYKVKFITYQTGFNIGPIKNRKQADHFNSFLAECNMTNIFFRLLFNLRWLWFIIF